MTYNLNIQDVANSKTILRHHQPLDQVKCDENARTEKVRLAETYAALFVLPSLTLEQEEQLGDILAAASQDEALDQLLCEVEVRCGKQLGLLDDAHCHSYENQKAFLREYLGADLSKRPLFGHNVAAG